mmetsp:Transcript_31719/g.93047  ORF Transcript_31719/g.93047 Transcript_31719/m.93047 type:complete len:127 (-) Transcript_31719:116-496(-)
MPEARSRPSTDAPHLLNATEHGDSLELRTDECAGAKCDGTHVDSIHEKNRTQHECRRRVETAHEQPSRSAAADTTRLATSRPTKDLPLSRRDSSNVASDTPRDDIANKRSSTKCLRSANNNEKTNK